jgi:hypothetical protein
MESLKKDVEFLKLKLSPVFIAKIEKAVGQLSTLHYDLEVLKMTTSSCATKKELEFLDGKLRDYTKNSEFTDLCALVRTMTPQREHDSLL